MTLYGKGNPSRKDPCSSIFHLQELWEEKYLRMVQKNLILFTEELLSHHSYNDTLGNFGMPCKNLIGSVLIGQVG